MRRLSHDIIDQHPVRRFLLDTITKNRAANIQTLASACGLSRAATRHHLRELEAAGRLSSAKVGRQRVYFRASDPVAGSAAMLAQPTSLRIAQDIEEHPGSTAREVAARTGASRRAVHHHAKRLREAGLVTAEAEPFQFTATPLLISLVGARLAA